MGSWAQDKPVNMEALLRQVNAIRVAFGSQEIPELMPGKKSVGSECPIAMSLANGWHPEVADAIEMFKDGGFTLEEGIEICKRLTAQGFRGVRIFDRGAVQLYPRIGKKKLSAFGGPPHEIYIPLTPTMDNFIDRFDNGDFEQLVKGRNGNSVL